MIGLSIFSDKAAAAEQYDVCEEHGHDYRDKMPAGMTTDFTRFVRIPDDAAAALPGVPIGYWRLQQEYKKPCRDCEKVLTKKETVQSRVLFRQDGEVKSISERMFQERIEAVTAEPID